MLSGYRHLTLFAGLGLSLLTVSGQHGSHKSLSAAELDVKPTSHFIESLRLPFRFEKHGGEFISRNPNHAVLLKQNGVEIGLKPVPSSKFQVQSSEVPGPGSRVQGQRSKVKGPGSRSGNRFEYHMPYRIWTPNPRPQTLVLDPKPYTRNPVAKQPFGIRNQSRISNPLSVSLSFVGSSSETAPSGVDSYRFNTNYLLGNKTENWQTEVQSYSKVRYNQLYPGIDLVFYGNQDNLEYDFVVSPDTDPSIIKLKLDPIDAVHADSEGNLHLQAYGQSFQMRKPVAYQEIDGERKEIPCNYQVEKQGPTVQGMGSGVWGLEKDLECQSPVSDLDPEPYTPNPAAKPPFGIRNPESISNLESRISNQAFPTPPELTSDEQRATSNVTVSFETGSYDSRYALTIDPILTYSTYLGGGHGDSISAIAVDTSGNIYVTGWTQSLNYPTKAAFQGELSGSRDAFVTKLQPDGSSIVFSTFIGGAGVDEAADIQVDKSGSVFLAGTTTSQDFPTQQPFMPSIAGSSDVFALKLNANGSSLSFSTYLGGSGQDEARAIAIDDQGAMYLAGSTRSTNFTVVEGGFQAASGGGWDAFVTKFSGSSLVSSTYLGGGGNDFAADLAVDSAGNSYIAGTTGSTDFPLKNAFQDTRKGSNEVFAAKLNQEASGLVFSTYLGGSSSDVTNCATLDKDGRFYVAGETSSSNFPTANPLQGTRSTSPDMFVTRFAVDGTQLDYSTYLGGLGFDSASDAFPDDAGNLTLAGLTTSTDFPLAGTLFAKQPGADAVVARLDPTGSSLRFSTYLGGSASDLPTAVAQGPTGAIYFAGILDSSDYPTMNPLQEQFAGVGLYKTTTAASNWGAAASGLTDANVQVIIADPMNAGTLYAGTAAGGVFKSTDRASVWSYLGLEGFPILSLAIDPTDADVLYAGTAGFVFKSVDAGEQWQVTAQGLPVANFTVVAVDPQDPSFVYAGTDGRGIFKTTSAGETWRAINSGLSDPGKTVFSLAIDPHNPANLYLGTNGTVYSSTTWGDLWNATSYTNVGPVRTLAIDKNSPSTIYASGVFSGLGAIVGKTTDSGEIWNATPIPGDITKLDVHPNNSNTLYAATADNGILHSTDAGKNWEVKNAGLNSREILTLAIDRFAASTIYAGTASGGDGFLTCLEPTNIFYFPQVADGQLSRLQFQTTLIMVNTGEDTTVKVEFFGSDGQPLELPFEGLGTGTEFEFPLKKGAALSTQSLGVDDVKVGYAKVTTTDGVDGTAVFTRTDFVQKKILFEAGVPASRAQTQFVFLLDSLLDKDTGVAIVNPGLPPYTSSGPANVELTLYDADLNLISQKTHEFLPGEHRARFISELFPEVAVQASEMRGIITAASDKPVVAVTVRQSDDPNAWFPDEVATMTTFPVILSNSLNPVLYFPQAVDGVFAQDQFQTTFILANAGITTASVTLAFFDSQGDPMDLNLDGLGDRNNVRLTLVPRQFVFLQTTGTGEPKVGYARLTSNTLSVGGTAIFTQTDIPTEVTLFEAGVPSASPRKTFSIFHDSLGVRDTGIAFVNGSEEIAQVTVHLFDTDLNLISQNLFEIQPGAHMARYSYQLFETILAREMEGVVTVRSTQPLAAVTVRQINDVDLVFPNEVPTLTTFPVIVGAPE